VTDNTAAPATPYSRLVDRKLEFRVEAPSATNVQVAAPGMPVEFEEIARIDGAGPWKTFILIMLPNAKPAVVTLAILSFLANWNDFIWPIYVLLSPERLTLPVGLSKLQGSYTIDYPVIMAGAAFASVPLLILYVLVQRYVIEGVASSGVKG